MKKFLAMLLAMAMVLGMSLTSFAEEEKKMPTSGDSATASVTNIKQEGVTVTAYKVVEANYDAQRGFTGYSWVDGTGYNAEETKRDLFTDSTVNGTTTKTLNIDEAAIVALAEKAKNGALGNGTEMKPGNPATTYKATLPAGSYVVIVTGSDDIIYNPMLIGVYYTLAGTGDNNTLVTDELDATTAWDLFTTTGFVKSSEPTVEKEIVNPGSDNNHGDDVAVGDTVSFKIKTKMPSYSEQYTAPQFKVSDTVSAGLTYKAGTLLVSTDGSKENAIPADNYTITGFDESSKTFTVAFATEYIKANQGTDIIITYDAVLNDAAGINFDANTNTAKLEYSNNPDPSADLKEKEDTTYHYTFGIDAALNGSDSEKTQELYKLDENGTAVVEGETVKVTSPLAGAKFRLQKKNADGSLDADHVYEAISGPDGSLSFTGLDAGEYVLVETEAPAGYSLDPTEHTVSITAVYYDTEEDNGKLKNYTITIDGTATSTYEATYENIDGTKVTTIDKTHLGITGIKNTKLASLPSTGGIGTTIFTIGGCAIMILAAGLYFASRRKITK